MIFSTILFLWIFLPLTLCGYYVLPKPLRNTWLLVMSLTFYSWGEPKYIILMVISIFMNYFAGLLISNSRKQILKKIWLFIAVLFNLCLLGFFKYYNFFIQNMNAIFQTSPGAFIEVALPIGISFYTFQSLSYVIDLYRGQFIVQKNPFKLALYISFFPQLIAGPIVQYSTIEKQLISRCVTIKSFNYGIKRFIYGLAKKVLIANTLAMPADQIFSLPYENLELPIAWLGIVCYTLQIYFDFSAYSDMAIGLGKMFGFDFPENFHYPYVSKSVKEFWRRWHMSLSSWFREYLYIPLGGNRHGVFCTYRNLFIVFFATGLWHGANWTFVLWGVFHGIFLIIERMGLGNWLEKQQLKILNHIYTLLVVIIGWVLFRSNSLVAAVHYLKTMFGLHNGWNDVSVWYYLTPFVFFVLVIAIIGCGFSQKHVLKSEEYFLFSSIRVHEYWFLPLLFILSLIVLVSDSYNPFIYFRF